MDEYLAARLAGAQIFRLAIEHINQHGWHHNSMDILLAVSDGKRWPQPMAVLMYSELSHVLGHETLTQFDARVNDPQSVITLFTEVMNNLESDK